MKHTKNLITIVLFVYFTIFFCFTVTAHSGRTDSNGGHYDHNDGSYHYHHGYPEHQHPNDVCPYIQKNKTETTQEKTFGLGSAIVVSIFVGWIGGALLLSIFFWPLQLLFYNFFQEHFVVVYWCCSILIGSIVFISLLKN